LEIVTPPQTILAYEMK